MALSTGPQSAERSADLLTPRCIFAPERRHCRFECQQCYCRTPLDQGSVSLYSKALTSTENAHMDDKHAAMADALELLYMNQTAIRAAIEEVSTWVRQRGSLNVHENTLIALQALDTNSDALA